MATAGRDHAVTAVDELATALRGADLVRIASAASGDALAATGTLARALSAIGTPFQASVIGPGTDATRATDADLTVGVRGQDPSADLTIAGSESASATAFGVATELTPTPDPALALAGTLAAGVVDERVARSAEDAGLARRPGVAVPTADLADGLAHSTLFHAPFSGDLDATREALAALSIPAEADVAELEEADRRRVASFVALEASEPAARERAASAVERGLRPYAGGPLGTVGGFADVLDAAARSRPGLAVSLALGDESVAPAALESWRTRAQSAHEAVRTCDTARYDGLVVTRGESMPVATVARLLADYRAPEPVVLAVADGGAAAFRAVAERGEAAGGVDLADALAVAAEAADGAAVGTESRASARFEGEAEAVIAAFREAR
jgi:hypothetical protein